MTGHDDSRRERDDRAPGSGPDDKDTAGSDATNSQTSNSPTSNSPATLPATPDPWKGFRGVMAAVLILESIVVLLTLLVLSKFGDNGGALGVFVVLALAAAMIATTRLLSKPWALHLALALQVVMMACGLLEFTLGVLGLVFGLVWVALLMMRRDVARRMARGELPGQRQ